MIGKMHPAERRRRAELRELARLMRERASLAPAPVPVPLHRMGARRAAIKTTAGSAPAAAPPIEE